MNAANPISITVNFADPDRVADVVLARAAEVLVVRLEQHARQRLDELLDKAVARACDGHLDAAVADVIAHGWHDTNQWGEPTGRRVPLREKVTSYLMSKLDDRNTRIERLMRRAVQEALEGELKPMLEEARAGLRAMLQEGVLRQVARAAFDASGVRWLEATAPEAAGKEG